MKKYLFIAVLAMASVMAYAQPRAIGANLGSGLGFSYQHGFGEANMLDVSANIPVLGGWGINGKVTYDWIDPFGATVPWNEKGEWHWYMGVGGAIATYGWGFNNGFIGAAGRIGIEYDFWFPLQLSIDFRPTLGCLLAGNGNGGVAAGFGWDVYAGGLGLGIRYKF